MGSSLRQMSAPWIEDSFVHASSFRANGVESAAAPPRGGKVAQVIRRGGDFFHYYEDGGGGGGAPSFPPHLVLHDGEHSAVAFLSPATLAGLARDGGRAMHIPPKRSLVGISDYAVATALQCTAFDLGKQRRIMGTLCKTQSVTRAPLIPDEMLDRICDEIRNPKLFMCLYLQGPVAFVDAGARGVAGRPLDVHCSGRLRRVLMDHERRYRSPHVLLARRLEECHRHHQQNAGGETAASDWPWETCPAKQKDLGTDEQQVPGLIACAAGSDVLVSENDAEEPITEPLDPNEKGKARANVGDDDKGRGGGTRDHALQNNVDNETPCSNDSPTEEVSASASTPRRANRNEPENKKRRRRAVASDGEERKRPGVPRSLFMRDGEVAGGVPLRGRAGRPERCEDLFAPVAGVGERYALSEGTCIPHDAIARVLGLWEHEEEQGVWNDGRERRTREYFAYLSTKRTIALGLPPREDLLRPSAALNVLVHCGGQGSVGHCCFVRCSLLNTAQPIMECYDSSVYGRTERGAKVGQGGRGDVTMDDLQNYLKDRLQKELKSKMIPVQTLPRQTKEQDSRLLALFFMDCKRRGLKICSAVTCEEVEQYRQTISAYWEEGDRLHDQRKMADKNLEDL